MHTESRIDIVGNIDRLFTMAAAVEAWPRILPHYRWVTVLSEDTTGRIVEMAAHRDGFPVRWTAHQRLDREQSRIYFTHVRGITRGMEVCWFLEAHGLQVHVRIVHDLKLRWPLIGDFVAQQIIGKLFVANIANKTLQTMKHLIEHTDVCMQDEPSTE